MLLSRCYNLVSKFGLLFKISEFYYWVLPGFLKVGRNQTRQRKQIIPTNGLERFLFCYVNRACQIVRYRSLVTNYYITCRQTRKRKQRPARVTITYFQLPSTITKQGSQTIYYFFTLPARHPARVLLINNVILIQPATNIFYFLPAALKDARKSYDQLIKKHVSAWLFKSCPGFIVKIVISL